MRAYEKTERRFERRQLKRRVTSYTVILLAAVSSIMGLALWATPMGRSVELHLLRAFFQLRGPISPPNNIVVVAIDDQLLDRFGRPLPRSVFAELFERLATAEPRGLVVDFSFPPDAVDPVANQRMAAALSRIPSVIGGGLMRSPDEQGLQISIGTEPVLKAAAKWQLPMRLRDSGGVIKLITLNPSKQASPVTDAIPLSRALIEFMGISPTKPSVFDLVNYYGPSGTITRLTAQEVLSSSLARLEHRVKNKLLVFGRQSVPLPSTQGDGERFETPFSEQPIYGAEIHATILANLMDGRWLRGISPSGQAAVFYLGALLSGAVLLRSRRWLHSVWLFGGLIFFIIGSYALFVVKNIWAPVFSFLLIYTTCVMIGASLFRLVLSSRLNRLIDQRLGITSR